LRVKADPLVRPMAGKAGSPEFESSKSVVRQTVKLMICCSLT